MSRKTKWLTIFVPHRLELVLSPAWRLAPVPLRRLLERLEIEHMRHGGFKNGALYVSYAQLQAAGISRRKISALTLLGESLGLLEVLRQLEPLGDLRGPSSYRLTYLQTKSAAPTDEWKLVNEDQASTLVDRYHDSERSEVKDRYEKRQRRVA